MVAPTALMLGILLLTVPPEPPPAPDLLAAAAELRRIAPLTPEARDDFVHKAAYRIAWGAVNAGGSPPEHLDLIPLALPLITAKIAPDRPRIDAAAAGCLDQKLGYAFDLETLQDMAKAVTTRGGNALWMRAVREPAQACYDEAVSNALVGFPQAISWLAGKGLIGRVPQFDPVKGDAGFARDLEALCGRKARGVVQIRSGRAGLPNRWVDREIRRRDPFAYSCLTNAAIAVRHELRIFDE